LAQQDDDDGPSRVPVMANSNSESAKQESDAASAKDVVDIIIRTIEK
jgi:hypothetical protein